MARHVRHPLGVRGVLVVYNVWLDSADLGAARAIARTIRESSRGLPALHRPWACCSSERGSSRFSMNPLDYRVTSLARAHGAVHAAADARRITITRSELVGLAPRAALAGLASETVGLADMKLGQYLETNLDALS